MSLEQTEYKTSVYSKNPLMVSLNEDIWKFLQTTP